MAWDVARWRADLARRGEEPLYRLARLVRDFDVDCAAHLVPPPDEGAAPERQKLAEYSLRDAARLAAAVETA